MTAIKEIKNNEIQEKKKSCDDQVKHNWCWNKERNCWVCLRCGATKTN